MNMAGYSGTPLIKKLGIKAGNSILVINAPVNYLLLVGELPERVSFAKNEKVLNDFIHFFTKDAEELKIQLPKLRLQLKQHGMIWVSWPKKSSKVLTDITEDTIRHFAFANDLVDVKVCAVDEIWSGLKLVIRVALRKK